VVKQGIPIVLLSLGLAATLAAQTTPARGPNINDVMKKATAAQAPTPPPTYKYQVSPQAGPWLVCVQTFKGVQAQQLAEELAEILIRDFKIPTYLYDYGHKQREAERARVEKLRQERREMFIQMEKQGLPPTVDGLRRWYVPEMKIDDEFAVLVGKSGRQLKDMEAARDYLDDIRKIKNLPKKFHLRPWISSDEGKKAEEANVFINPFVLAMVVHNPTMPLERQQDDPAKADKFLKELNSDEDYSLLKCRKTWTLVVKVYQAPSELLNREGPAMTPRFNPNKKEGESYLNIGALQAHRLAEFLRKSLETEAYVLHHRYYSLVTVGQYDAPDDPQLLAHQKTFANMQLKTKTGQALETFSAQPLPMRIPK
jgi:hypothetical protein